MEGDTADARRNLSPEEETMEDVEIAHMQVSTCPQCGAPIYIKVASSGDLAPWTKENPPPPEYSCECRISTGQTWVKYNV